MADNFEKKISRQMDDFKIHPSEAVWQKVDAQLRKDKRRRWFFFLLSVGVLLGSGSFLIYERSHNASAHVRPQPVAISSKTGANTSKENEQLKLEPSSSAIPSQRNDAVSENNIKEDNKPVLQNNSFPNTISKSAAKTKIVESNIVADKKVTTMRKPASSNNISANHLPAQKTAINSKAEPVKKQTVHLQTPVVDTTVQITGVNNTPVDKQSTNTQPASTNKKTTDSATRQVALQEQQRNETVTPNEKVAVDSPAPEPVAAKRKMQTGWSLNAGITDVRSSVIPAKGFTTADTYAIPLTGTSGIPGGLSGLLSNEYSIRSNVQAGVGYAVRFPFGKKAWFVTGVQYQYHRFSVIERVRRDTFSAAQNRLVSNFSNENKTAFNFHYISIPTEVQWQIAQTTKGKLMLGTGLLHSFKFAASTALPSFADSTSAAAFYQPIIQLTPAYEWKTKKGVMQLGWYFNYGLLPVYNNVSKNHWWQTGLRVQYWFKTK
ncbi:MAG: outer membrane beta-barrel protein [Chitinophagaceae bacterium]|nr:outer membrane beta-barrel protein [Chitinophagaceae bacterium]